MRNKSSSWTDRQAIMSTQSYYKDRLGFDPREALYDGPSSHSSTTVKSGSRSRVVHYSSTSHHSNGNQYDYHHSKSPAKKLKHSAQYHSSSSTSTMVSGGNTIVSGNNNNSQADGYEDALTQFKGMMSIWEYFVENWDITGTQTSKWKALPMDCVCRYMIECTQCTYSHGQSVPFVTCFWVLVCPLILLVFTLIKVTQ